MREASYTQDLSFVHEDTQITVRTLLVKTPVWPFILKMKENLLQIGECIHPDWETTLHGGVSDPH